MYLGFYQLLKEPFHVTPDPAFLYLSPSHKEALAAIVYGVERRKGFMAVTGEVGSGKTTIIRSALQRINRERVCLIQLFNPDTTYESLLDTLLQELGIDPRIENSADKLRYLQQALIEEYSRGSTIVLIIDEAQNMPVDTLERLRMLSNLETDEAKLLQIVLVGQPELDEKLQRHELRQLSQRIAFRMHLRQLTFKESIAYVKHRLEVAMAAAPVFTDGAMRQLARRSKGNPRTLSVLCDNALIAGYGLQERPVGARTVRRVISDYFRDRPRLWFRSWQFAIAGAVGLAALLYVAVGPARAFVRGEPRRAATSGAIATEKPLPHSGKTFFAGDNGAAMDEPTTGAEQRADDNSHDTPQGTVTNDEDL